MRDAEILKMASGERLMVITMDKDFGELVYHSGRQHSGVLILRLDDATGQEKVETVRKILSGYAKEIFGNFCVFQNGRLRIRH